MHTPSNFSIFFTQTGGRFERDGDFMGGDPTAREKTVSDGRDSSVSVRRQSPYIERVRQPDVGGSNRSTTDRR